MPARHRYHHSGEARKTFAITLKSCSRSAGIRVHDALETVTTIDRNMHNTAGLGVFLNLRRSDSGVVVIVSSRVVIPLGHRTPHQKHIRSEYPSFQCQSSMTANYLKGGGYVAVQLDRRDEGAMTVLLSRYRAAAKTLVECRTTDAQDARGFSDFKAKVRKGFRNDCHTTPPCQCGSALSWLYSSASTKLSRLWDFTTHFSVVQRKECPAAGVAALVHPILWVRQPALIVGGSMGDD
jgi:hypothetical protein